VSAPTSTVPSPATSDDESSFNLPELLDQLPQDEESLELQAEKAAEASFMKAQEALLRHHTLDMPTDFYLDPLRAIEHSDDLALEEVDLTVFELPVEINTEVGQWLEFFLTRGRGFYTDWLARSSRYLPMIEEVLAQEGLPRELAYLPMIESGFSPRATSSMQAAGIWQLMPATGKSLGLRVDGWTDERRDPELATRAAAQYLKEMHERFEDWYLAMAAYNAGPAKVGRALERTGARSYWSLCRTGQLRPETTSYVPKLLAAAIIARNPERFGFSDVAYDDAIVTETVAVNGSTDLELLSRRLNVDRQQLSALNPALRRGRTPPGRYEVHLPAGYAAVYEVAFADVRPDARLVYRQHTVRSGQNLSGIAREYGVSVAELRQMNNLKDDRLAAGQALLVPQREALLEPEIEGRGEVELTQVALQEGTDLPQAREAVAARAPQPSSSPTRATRAVHEVRPGDSMWSIARQYTVSVQDLVRYNALNPQAPLQVGQRIDIPAR
jgi:membrane-bound lytic murein transglycosylase D